VGRVAAVLLAAILVGTALYLRVAFQPVRAVRVSVLPPEKASFETSLGPVVISPDGTKLAFVARVAGGSAGLWVRPLDALTAQPLAGTEGASFPFWLPDSRFIGFFAGGKLKKIEASGGPPQSLCDAPSGRGGSWNRDGAIIFTPNITDVIYRVSSAGGPTTPLTKLAPGQTSQRWPDFLPDGRHFLFFVHTATAETMGTYVSSLDGSSPQLVVRGEYNAVYAPPGYLLFVRERTLMAQPFDAGKLELTGDPFPVTENVDVNPVVWRGGFAASGNGALIFHTSAASGGWQLAWFDRSGKQTGTVGQPDFYWGQALLPDGRRLAVTVSDPPSGTIDLWVFGLARGVRTRLTFGPGLNTNPVWSPDGSRIAFISTRNGVFHSYVKATNGTGPDEPLIETNARERVNSWSSDGKYLAYMRDTAQEKKDVDVWILPLFGDRKPFPFLQSPFNEGFPQFSPNVKWLAYTSDQSGKDQIYVVPFPTGNGKWQISTNGGFQPKWRRDGRELYYLAPDNSLMAVDITERGSTLEIGNPHALFQTHPPPARPGYYYDVSPDGKRFLLTNENSQGSPGPATLVLNWTAGLKK
jgi:eukaryotic-like serine/threonine-protein kinase